LENSLPALKLYLAHIWHGPYRIMEVVNDFTYKLNLAKECAKFFPLVHISRIKPFRSYAERPMKIITDTNKIVDFGEALVALDRGR